MSVLTPPPQDELELLIREARARQRARRVGLAALLAGLAALGLGLNAVWSRGHAGSASHGRPALAAASCRSTQLRLSGGFAGAGAGNDWFDFAFRNASGATCAVKGWPTVELRFAGGRVLTVRSRVRYVTAAGKVVPVRAVALRPGSSASFTLHVLGTHNGGRPCPQTGDVSVVPPGASAPVRAVLTRAADVPATVWACAGKAWVAPVRAGRKRIYDTQ